VEMLQRCVLAFRDGNLNDVDAVVLAIHALKADIDDFAQAFADIRRDHPPVPHEVN